MAIVCALLITRFLMLNDNRDFANTYSSATVCGIDITPIQPVVLNSKVEFIMDDINSSLYEAGTNTWDLIHIREMEGGVKNWPDLLRKLYM